VLLELKARTEYAPARVRLADARAAAWLVALARQAFEAQYSWSTALDAQDDGKDGGQS
jgi:hypothetical protein